MKYMSYSERCCLVTVGRTMLMIPYIYIYNVKRNILFTIIYKPGCMGHESKCE